VRLAFLVPDPDYPEAWDWAFDAEAEALRKRGATVDPVPWTRADDLSGYDLVLPLVVWGYHLQYADWGAFLDRIGAEDLPVVNPPELLRWNSDKVYLTELAAKGVPTVETIEVEHLGAAELAAAAKRFGTSELVVKPPVSASATGTHRIRAGDEIPASERGQRMMIQPFLLSIATEGEYAVILFNGVYSHTVVKRPKSGDFRVQPHLGGSTEPCEPPAGAVELAKAALGAAPADATYARVDIVRGAGGELLIMELELIEPALFLDVAPHGEDAFADSVIGAAERARSRSPARRAS
jgi:glutathione synthase/RimK-type ligase-like ATP-grasp enzyme